MSAVRAVRSTKIAFGPLLMIRIREDSSSITTLSSFSRSSLVAVSAAPRRIANIATNVSAWAPSGTEPAMCMPLRETRTASLTPGIETSSLRMPSSAATSAIHTLRRDPSDKVFPRASVLSLIKVFLRILGTRLLPRTHAAEPSQRFRRPHRRIDRAPRVLHARLRLLPRHPRARDPEADRFPGLPLQVHELPGDRLRDQR